MSLIEKGQTKVSFICDTFIEYSNNDLDKCTKISSISSEKSTASATAVTCAQSTSACMNEALHSPNIQSPIMKMSPFTPPTYDLQSSMAVYGLQNVPSFYGYPYAYGTGSPFYGMENRFPYYPAGTTSTVKSTTTSTKQPPLPTETYPVNPRLPLEPYPEPSKE